MKNALTSAETAFNRSKEKLAAIRATIEQLHKQLERSTEADADGLKGRKNELTAQKNAITAAQKIIHTRITTNASAQKNIEKKRAEMEVLEHKFSWMKALSDTANGNLTGKDKIMLETYIQTTYFDRILERANIRLRKMSGGQYDLKRRKTAASKQSQSGLELDIVDHVNTTERSVNTLSGGEAFLASLALALGLSDEVQMSTGIKLDTLFVDEGFGSLDSEALSKAYSTLAGLTQGDRLVGIISHVEELVHSCGFYKHKARDIVLACQMLLAEYGGKVPNTMEELLRLPGVGRKTANLLLGDLYAEPGSVVCDTHCIRICGKLGLSEGKDPEKVERQLRAILPPEESNDFCHRIVLFGRDCCVARNPKCAECPLALHCKVFSG